MKKARKVSFFITCCVFLLLAGCSLPEPTPEKIRFSFGEDGRFKIAQFTDIHWVHGQPTGTKTVESIKAVLAAEKPDIAVLTGDIVFKLPDREPWDEIIAIFDETRTPFAAVLGNHDGEPSTKISRSEIFDLLSRSPYFVGEKGPEDIPGVGNYVLPVYGKNDTTAALLYCFDSHSDSANPRVSGYASIHHDQITWYRQQSDRYTAENGGKPLPALAFFHIPLPEYWQVIGTPDYVGRNEENPAPPKYNTGLFHSFLDKQDVMGTFVGHEHVNDYVGILEYIALAYGRVSGWEAYGDFERGARIVELYEGEFVFDTWIRTPAGIEQAFNYPTGISSVDEQTLTYLPARQVDTNQRQGVSYTYYEGELRSFAALNSSRKVSEGEMISISIADAPAQNHFTYEFRTLVHFPERAVYRFYTDSDDNAQLFIDNRLVVDRDRSYGERGAGKVALEPGFHELKLLYHQHNGGKYLRLGYSTKSIRERSLLLDDKFFIPAE